MKVNVIVSSEVLGSEVFVGKECSTIYMPASLRQIYEPDLIATKEVMLKHGIPATEENIMKFLFLHEMAHIWQSYFPGFSTKLAVQKYEVWLQNILAVSDEERFEFCKRYREYPLEKGADNYAIWRMKLESWFKKLTRQ